LFKVRTQRGKNINSLSTSYGDLMGPVIFATLDERALGGD
jgi:hypothetical protein